MKVMFKNTFIGLIAMLLAGLCTVAVPLLNAALHGHGGKKSGPKIVAQISLKSMEPPKPELKPRRDIRQPNRARPAPTMLKSGPRFAMELGVSGSGGAAVPIDIVNRKSGGGGRGQGANDEGVDERPAPTFPPPFQMPSEVKSREKDALVILSFCVDVSGRPYDIKVNEERPPGLGMAIAGREALQQTRFTPAKKGGVAVPYCGLEQPFEVRFAN